MRNSKRLTSGLSALALGLTGVALSAGPAAASHIGCGATITQNTTLDSDVGPCLGDGLVVAASNITVNLGGKRVFAVNARGDVAGVRLLGVSGVTVTSGTVQGFNDGVSIMGGSGNTIRSLRAIDNISDFGGGTGPNCNLGDGIGVFDSSNNLITGNVVKGNGPYGGISIVNNSDGNRVIGNDATGNNIASPTGANHPTCIDNEKQDEGIRIEGPGADNNVIQGNAVNRNLLAGIGIHASNNVAPSNDPPNTNNSIIGNSVHFNGYDATDPNDSGISILGTPGLRAFGNTIQQNDASDNAANGIYLPARSHDNVVGSNQVNRNGADGIFVEGPTFGNTFTNVGPSLLDLVSPDQPPFAQGTDYGVLSGSGSGDVTARLVPVGPIAIPPGAFDTSASGCAPSDFAGFPVGAVALIQRGFCGRPQKVANAVAAGASAVVMFNEGTAGRTGLLTAGVNPTTIPVIGTTYALGQQLYSLTQAGPVTIHVVTKTTNVQTRTGPGAENNKFLQNRGTGNTEHDGHDVNPACVTNQWSGNLFGTVNQACVAAGGTGTVKP